MQSGYTCFILKILSLIPIFFIKALYLMSFQKILLDYSFRFYTTIYTKCAMATFMNLASFQPLPGNTAPGREP
jgi:hypothetical protein